MTRSGGNGSHNKSTAEKAVKKMHAVEPSCSGSISKPTLITGGAGFIGTNLAHSLMSKGNRVIILDDLSRSGVENNLNWLLNKHGDLLDVQIGDVRKLDL